ncbi:hypothetical protein CPAST_c18410 [Clostridium pasteurianum DSM 525 = ATCC 6013]|uniref:Uncharacterized protein n=1 Tax=Clostridium pasteurianum DSM 525 = ATCC 6013 TaxID=1262449 RepID=A0A0H3J1X8_CLOPA|nr:hypothetical protein [Clostridium pasteurianum]AJA47911.1 hypothetical protein CPAST_c18410 [Clostridium pasteurianum DSM 525 = ATCC 6013]AJA51899.1 hypothetical protein CLPA_c18410 [Clostridium pasteurianum DSM 525 = ATCC 6013]AOZ75200.1 hypothetical protein AQ983_08935 [Clostridium pasteurianum DSM 525 = ATCC 6013]AOZ78995.1 hypothetical protein AQ984_08925 [Clostridium pasteurianum]ELP59814.1 hypothetical protein F502_08113 [Clostridium pasteurianum DSM 525 = ATCC 6013]
MGFKEKIQDYYTKSYLKKYGDRLTQVQGKVISVKLEEKSILWIFHKLIVTLIIKPDRSKNITKCTYKRNKWFKRPEFMTINQGNLLIVQGVKGPRGKGNGETVEVMNIRNMTTKKDLVKIEGNTPKTVRQIRRYK